MKFNAVLDKPVYALSVFFKFIGQAGIITAISTGILIAYQWIVVGHVIDVMDALAEVLSNPLYLLVIFFLLILNVRTIIFRLSDKEV
jgi:hypothetical protein